MGKQGVEELQKPSLGLSKSLSPTGKEPHFPSPLVRGIKFSQSLRVNRNPDPKSKADRNGWNFGAMAQALGSGMVQGTKAVGSGVVQGSQAVRAGVLQGSKAMSTGMVHHTLAAGKLTKDLSVSVVKDTTKWVRDQSTTLGYADSGSYTVLPGDTIEGIAKKQGMKVNTLISINLLNQRKLFPGQIIKLTQDPDQIRPHPVQVFVRKGFWNGDEIVFRFSPDLATALSGGTIILESNMSDLVQIHLDVCEFIDFGLNKEVSEGEKNLKKKEEFLIVMELELADCNQDFQRKFKAYFPLRELVSLHAFLDLWFPEKLEISKMFLNQLSIVTSGWTGCSDLDPHVLDQSNILNEKQTNKLHLNMSQKIWCQSWRMAYSTKTNGYSLLNLYRTLGEDSDVPCLMVVRDTLGFTFGAYLTCTPRICDGFIGTGKSWLFCFGRLEKSSALDNLGVCVLESNILNVFNWSGKNDYFFKGTADCMVMGASEGNFGIVIDSDLYNGRIQACQTFDGWTHRDHDFIINCLECWKFV